MYRAAASRLRALNKAREGSKYLARYASSSSVAEKTNSLGGILSSLFGGDSKSLPPLDFNLEGVTVPPPLPDYVEPAKTKITTLPNGVKVASEASPNPVASIGLYVDSGSIYESPLNFGATHLLELMAFKTTLNRSHLRVVREVEAIRGNVTASASREQMGYTIDALKTYVPEMVELIVDAGRRILGHNLASKHGYSAPSTFCSGSAMLGAAQDTAVSQSFLHRCFTTAANSVPSDTQNSTTPETNVPPRIKFKRLDKTARHIMQIVDKEAVEEVKGQRDFPDIKPGYIIQLKLEVPENKRRVTTIKGIVIARRNAGLNSTFRIRRLVAGVGVESLIPLYSPNIKEITVLDKKKVRRAKLYYLREKMNPLKK